MRVAAKTLALTSSRAQADRFIPLMFVIVPFAMGLYAQERAPAGKPPMAPVHPVTDEYFGQKFVDPYRWMEDEKSPEFVGWMKAQNEYARKYLDSLPDAAALLQRSREVEMGDVKVQSPLRRGERFLYTKYSSGDNLAKLYVRDGVSGTERLLYDPVKESTDKKHVSITDIGLSSEGRYGSFLVSAGGGEYGDLRFIDLSNGKELPDRIEDTRWWAGSWAPDSRSVLYIRFQKLASDAPAIERGRKSAIYRHVLGAAASADTPVFGFGVDSAIHISADDLSFVNFIKGSPYAVASVNTGVSPESDFYIARATDLGSGHTSWRKIASRTDKVSQVEVHGDDLYLLSFNDAPRYRLLKTSAVHPDAAKAQEIIAAGEPVLTGISAAKDNLYVETLEGGPHHVYRIDYASNRKQELPVPPQTSASIGDANLLETGVVLRVRSWIREPRVLVYDPKADTLLDPKLQPPSKLDTSAIDVSSVKVRSYDGTMIPLVILHRKGLALNKANPTLLTGYGSYGIESTSPHFVYYLLPWLERGGVSAFAGVRGGGEFGEEWHLAGKLGTKPNTWKDFIACAEYLVATGYTSPAHLGAEGGSAGGVLVGNALTERPDLFGAIVMEAGMTDTLRSETTANGVFNTAEFGSVSTEEGFRVLLAMDSYYKVKDGTPYPAVLFQGGMNDPRVNPFFSGKLGARLQAATTSGKPILLDFPDDQGHGVGSSLEQYSKNGADAYAFLFAQLSGAK